MQLYQTRNQGYLRYLKQIATTCGAKYLLPFANFVELFNPEHLKYVKETSKNRPADVKNFFADSSLEIIDILPGESWDGKNGKFVRRKDRKNVFQKNNIFSYIKKIQKTNLERTIPTSFNLSHNEIKRYFESFSDSQLSKKVGAYTVLLKLKTDFKDMSGLIKFEDGKITYQATETPKQANLTMICPGKMVQKIIREDLYWDEIISGYWCTFSRNPDIYNPHFEKVLHVPWKARQNNLIQNGSTKIKLTLSIADIIEKGDENIIKIFEKYGLFCAGCGFSTGETVEDGCRQHGIDSNSTKKLILELQNTIKNDQIQLN
jgi:CMP-N-acetylneuraminate monooxygenase